MSHLLVYRRGSHREADLAAAAAAAGSHRPGSCVAVADAPLPAGSGAHLVLNLISQYEVTDLAHMWHWQMGHCTCIAGTVRSEHQVVLACQAMYLMSTHYCAAVASIVRSFPAHPQCCDLCTHAAGALCCHHTQPHCQLLIQCNNLHMQVAAQPPAASQLPAEAVPACHTSCWPGPSAI